MNVMISIQPKGVSVMDGYLKISEVAKRLGLPRRTVIRMANKGHLAGAIKQNPHALTSPIIIPVKSVEDFLKERDKGLPLQN